MEPKTLIVRPATPVVMVGQIVFYRYACEWLDEARAAERRLSSPPVRYSPLPYFLYCRTIEHALKAFLLATMKPPETINDDERSAWKLKRLKDDLGHNLVDVLAEAINLRLNQDVAITPEHINEVARVNKYYQSKGFEYFGLTMEIRDSKGKHLELAAAMTSYENLPDLQVLADFASHLVEKLKSICQKPIHLKAIDP